MANTACACFCVTLTWPRSTAGSDTESDSSDASAQSTSIGITVEQVKAVVAGAVASGTLHVTSWLDWKLGVPSEGEDEGAQMCLYGSSTFEQESTTGNDLELALSQLLEPMAAELGVTSLEVELVATLPTRIPLETLALNDVTHASATASTDGMRQQLQRLGLVVLKDALEEETLGRAKAEADGAIARVDKALKAAGVNVGFEDFRFREISSRQKQRFDLLLDQEMCSQVRTLGMTGPWRSLVDAILGPDVVFQTSVVYSRPGAEEQTWHADGPHIGRTADWDGCGEEAPYALCVFVPLVQFSRELGFTQFWPGSHKYAGLLGFGPVCPLIECAVDGIVELGSALVYDYRLIHRGMPNTSEASERPMLQFLYHRPSYKEARNYGNTSLFAQ